MILVLLSLACLLAACAAPGASPQASAPTAAPSPTSAPSPAPQPTAAPTYPPTATSSPQPTETPTAAPTAKSTPSPRPPAHTPAPHPTAQPTTSARHVFPVRSKGPINYGKFHHDYPATDIFCPIGSSFVAVTDGVVDYVSRADAWDPAVDDGATRGGLSVAIIGDDGVRYYGSHLSQVAEGIAPGERVKIGQLLGLTGKSGDARYTDAHLHFGISRPSAPDDWATRRGQVSPYPYLRAWQRGDDVTPALPE